MGVLDFEKLAVRKSNFECFGAYGGCERLRGVWEVSVSAMGVPYAPKWNALA